MDIQRVSNVEFRVPTRVVIEPGCVQSLAAVVHRLPAKRVVFVTDAGLCEESIVVSALESLRAAGITVDLVADIETNPRTTTAERVALVARGAEAIVGFGGGSVMDAAKGAAMLATNPGRALDYVGANRFDHDPLPFIAVPTTCGTGSEVTWVSVLTDLDRSSKVSLKGDGMFPDVALVDSDLLMGLPARLIAETGLDALTHALEATTGRRHNPAVDALAEASIDLTFRFLARAVADAAGDAESREGVARAATLAGMAFGNSDVAGVHCLSETLGGLYDISHGLANAVLLVPVMRYHEPKIADRLASLGRRVAAANPAYHPDRFLDAVSSLVESLGIPGFSSFDIAESDDVKIAAGAVANGSNDSNPQPMAEQDYLTILKSIRS